MEATRNLAHNLRAYRLAQNKSMQEFSVELGISKTTLHKLEQGTNHFSSATLEHIAARLGVHPASLLGDTSEFEAGLLIYSIAFALSSMSRSDLAEAEAHLQALIQLMQPAFQQLRQNLG